MATTSVKNAISNAMQSPTTVQGNKGMGDDPFFGDHAVSTFVSSKSANNSKAGNAKPQLSNNTTPSLGNASSTTTSTLNHNNLAQSNIGKTDTAAEQDEDDGGSSGEEASNSPDGKGKTLAKKKSKKPQKPQQLLFCTSKCRYAVIKKAVKQLGFKLTDDETADWDIYWNDT